MRFEAAPPGLLSWEENLEMPDVTEATGAHEPLVYASKIPGHHPIVREYAQRLHTAVYLERGYIEADELDSDGLFVDAYADRSVYLYVQNGHKVTAARYITCDKETSLLSLPTAKNFDIDPEILRKAAGSDSLTELKPKDVIEISGLVSRMKHVQNSGGNLDATITLYAHMLRESLEQGHKLWMLNVDARFLRHLRMLVGDEHIHELGPAKEYMGPPTSPVAINPRTVVRSVLQDTSEFGKMKRDHVVNAIAGLNDKRIPKDIRKMLKEHEVPTTHYSATKRIVTDPKTWAYASILGYSAARPLLAGTVEEFDGSTAVLWGVDVATAGPYTWGLIETFRKTNSLKRRAVAAVIGSASFIAPYVYFAAEGNDYPGYVNTAVASMIGAAVTKETVSQVLRRRKERKIHNDLRSEEE